MPEIINLYVFKFCTILSIMMKSRTVPPLACLECESSLCPEYPHCIGYPHASHLADISGIWMNRSTEETIVNGHSGGGSVGWGGIGICLALVEWKIDEIMVYSLFKQLPRTTVSFSHGHRCTAEQDTCGLCHIVCSLRQNSSNLFTSSRLP